MRWPADMYAALEPTGRPARASSPRRSGQRHTSTPLTFMALVIFLIACLALGATYVTHRDAVGAADFGKTSGETPTLLNARVTANLVALTSAESGRVASLELEPGESFTKDTVLVRLEDTSHHAELARAERELEQANQQMHAEKARIALERKQTQASVDHLAAALAECDADIKAAQAAAERWDSEQERMKGFRRPHYELQRQRDEVQMHLKQAAANVASAHARKLKTERELAAAHIALEIAGVRKLSVAHLRERIADAEARASAARAAIEQSGVRAPTDGRIVEYFCEAGSAIRRGDRVLAWRAGDEVWVEAWATSEEAKELQVGDEVEIELNTQPAKTLVGRIETVTEDNDLQLNARQARLLRLLGGAHTPTHVLKISLPDGQAGLEPGIEASVQKRGTTSLGRRGDHGLYAVAIRR